VISNESLRRKILKNTEGVVIYKKNVAQLVRINATSNLQNTNTYAQINDTFFNYSITVKQNSKFFHFYLKNLHFNLVCLFLLKILQFFPMIHKIENLKLIAPIILLRPLITIPELCINLTKPTNGN
jgi:hypothetical protein